MKIKLPNKLKGHHLLALAFNPTLNDWGKVLVAYKYVDNQNHLFARILYETYSALRLKPNHQKIIIEGDPDFFCNNCPNVNVCYNKKRPNNREMMLLLDRYYLKNNSLKIGRIYSVAEIQKVINPNSGNWKKELLEKIVQ